MLPRRCQALLRLPAAQVPRRCQALLRDEDYLSVYREAGLELERSEKPLATGEEGIPWVSETNVAPWAIYLLRRLDDVQRELTIQHSDE